MVDRSMTERDAIKQVVEQSITIPELKEFLVSSVKGARRKQDLYYGTEDGWYYAGKADALETVHEMCFGRMEEADT